MPDPKETTPFMKQVMESLLGLVIIVITALQIILLVVKFVGGLDSWSWWAVMSPLLFTAGVVSIVMLISYIIIISLRR